MNRLTHARTRGRAFARLGLAATLGALVAACGGGGGMPFPGMQAAANSSAAARSAANGAMPPAGAQTAVEPTPSPAPAPDAATLMQMGGAP